MSFLFVLFFVIVLSFIQISTFLVSSYLVLFPFFLLVCNFFLICWNQDLAMPRKHIFVASFTLDFSYSSSKTLFIYIYIYKPIVIFLFTSSTLLVFGIVRYHFPLFLYRYGCLNWFVAGNKITGSSWICFVGLIQLSDCYL